MSRNEYTKSNGKTGNEFMKNYVKYAQAHATWAFSHAAPRFVTRARARPRTSSLSKSIMWLSVFGCVCWPANACVHRRDALDFCSTCLTWVDWKRFSAAKKRTVKFSSWLWIIFFIDDSFGWRTTMMINFWWPLILKSRYKVFGFSCIFFSLHKTRFVYCITYFPLTSLENLCVRVRFGLLWFLLLLLCILNKFTMHRRFSVS